MRRFTLAAVVGAALVCSPVMAQSTTYQGRLDLGGAPANGEYDFQFVVYPSMVGGAALDTTSIGGLPVANGLFTASISVQTAMSQVATGWLELRVRRSGDPFFLALSPRQELTPAPRAASLRLPFIQSGESATDSGSIVNLTNSRATGGGALTGFGRLWGLIGVAGNITSYPLLPAVTGVVGISSSGTGVAGVSSGGDGVYGRSSSGAGGFFEAILLDTGTALRVETSAANASAAEFARLETSATGPAVRITSASTAAGASALTSEMTSVAPGGFSAAVRAINAGTGGSGIGVWASQAGSGWGVYSTAGNGGRAIYGSGGGTTGHAGYFDGRVHVTGTLSKAAGSFKIDHPLDPENRYLSHSFVESPEMKNIYDGVVTLDSLGHAKVTMPEWFDALNSTFRYQLTAIGAPGPNLYIARKIEGNTFEIAGGAAGMEVSWQVTGVREDAYAKKNRIVVEEEKSETEKGKYLNPEAFGYGPEKSIGARPNSPE